MTKQGRAVFKDRSREAQPWRGSDLDLLTRMDALRHPEGSEHRGPGLSSWYVENREHGRVCILYASLAWPKQIRHNKWRSNRSATASKICSHTVLEYICLF